MELGPGTFSAPACGVGGMRSTAPEGLRGYFIQLREFRDQFGVEGQSVLSGDLRNCVGAGPFREATHLLEEAFKACRAEELKGYRLDVGRVPHCVRDAAWLNQKPALLNHQVVVADTAADAPTEYEGEFVFLSVGVRDEQLTRS